MSLLLLFMGVMTLLIMSSVSLIMWWAMFFMVTLLFLLVAKSEWSANSLLVYFVIQEFSGLAFLLSMGMGFQGAFLMLKVGVSPFHFWVNSLVFPLKGSALLWFLTVQKVPYLAPLFLVITLNYFWVIVFGLFVVYSQIFLVKSGVMMVTLSSVESFSWALLTLLVEPMKGGVLFLTYLLAFWVLMSNSESVGGSVTSPELTFWLLGMPLGLPFMLKVYTLVELLGWGGLLFFLLLSFMSLSVWAYSYFVVVLSSQSGVWGGGVGFSLFLLFSLCLIL